MIVTAGILTREGRFLLSRRKPEDSQGVTWEFPGGKVRWGETPEACIVRELEEEIGVKARTLAIYDIVQVKPGMTILFYICDTDDEPRVIDCADVQWVSPSLLTSYPTYPTDMRIMRSLACRYQAVFDLVAERRKQ